MLYLEMGLGQGTTDIFDSFPLMLIPVLPQAPSLKKIVGALLITV